MTATATRHRSLILAAADLIEAAAARIDTYGHHKGSFRPPGADDPFAAPCCGAGALVLSAGIDPTGPRGADHPIPDADAIITEAEQIVAEWLVEHGNAEWHLVDGTDDLDCEEVIAVWNDDPAMTGEEVAETLRDIAAAARTYPAATTNDLDAEDELRERALAVLADITNPSNAKASA